MDWPRSEASRFTPIHAPVWAFYQNTLDFRRVAARARLSGSDGKPHAQGAGVKDMKDKPRRTETQDVVTLADLAPRHRVTGGSGRRVFGTDSHTRPLEEKAMATKKSAKDLSVKSPVKGGVGSGDGPKGPGKLATNDNVTLVRG
jgi:hypothetical protein